MPIMADANSLWRDRNKVFVAGIPAHVDDDALYAKFRPFGEMFQSKVVLDARTGRSKGFGFLTFADYAHALEAVAQMNQAKWENRVLNVRFLQPKASDGADGVDATDGGAAVTVARKRPAKVFGPCPTGCTSVYVGNLAYGITEPVLRKVFAGCGDVKAVRFAEHIQTKEFRGFGHVQFYDGAACEKAVQLDGMVVMGRPMNLDYGARDEAADKAREELQRKLKKGICHKFQAGECSRGDECKFAHVLKSQDPEQLLHAVPSMTGASATGSMSAAANGDETPVCQSFLKRKCKRGDKCKFQHVDSATAATPVADSYTRYDSPVAMDPAGETPVCQSYLNGKCKRGEKCKFRHVDQAEEAPAVPNFYEDRSPAAVDGPGETPVCQSFLTGKCKRGDKCKFRHVDATHTTSTAIAPVIPTLAQVRAPRLAVVAVPEVPVCLNFQKGTCTRGDACRYRHMEATTDTPKASETSGDTTANAVGGDSALETAADVDAPVCQSFLKGKCKRGAKCRFRHVEMAEVVSAPTVVPTISICQNFQRGRCSRGSSCRFAHTTELNDEAVAAAAAAKAAAAVSTAHSEYQKRFQSICYNWQNSRSCVRGDACPFFHDGAMEKQVTEPALQETSTRREDEDEDDAMTGKKEKKLKKEKKSKKRKAASSDSDSDSDDDKKKKKKKKHSKE